jgi:CubicO group peptidase (beta-lactamase class C family)
VAEGVLDDTLLVRDVIPEIGDSAFATATVREVMDMTTGVQYSENYSDPNADIWLYSARRQPAAQARGLRRAPDGYWEYLQQVSPEGKHGDEFHYKTINSDMLGWMISRVTGKSVTDLASERLWRRMGGRTGRLSDRRWQGRALCRRWHHAGIARSRAAGPADAERRRAQRRAAVPGRSG